MLLVGSRVGLHGLVSKRCPKMGGFPSNQQNIKASLAASEIFGFPARLPTHPLFFGAKSQTLFFLFFRCRRATSGERNLSAGEVPSMARQSYTQLAIYTQSQLCLSTDPTVLTLKAGFRSPRVGPFGRAMSGRVDSQSSRRRY